MTLLEAIEYCDKKSHEYTPDGQIHFDLMNFLDELRMRRLREEYVETQVDNMLASKYSLKK